MNRITNVAVFLLLIVFTAESLADVTMGIFPRRPAATTHKMFKPLVKKLGQELGEKVTLAVPKNFKTFWRELEAGKYDIVHYNQYHYLLSHEKYGYSVVAVNEEFGSSTIAGALTVRKDSGIESVKDMKGKTILFGGGKKAMGSYIATTSILKRAGLIAQKDYTVRFAKNPPGAVLGVYSSTVDVAGSGDVILQIAGVRSAIDTNQLKIVAKSDEFVHLPWAVSNSMPKDKALLIQSVMTNLKGNNDSILTSAKVTNFVTASDEDFEKVREIVKFVTGESL